MAQILTEEQLWRHCGFKPSDKGQPSNVEKAICKMCQSKAQAKTTILIYQSRVETCAERRAVWKHKNCCSKVWRTMAAAGAGLPCSSAHTACALLQRLLLF